MQCAVEGACASQYAACIENADCVDYSGCIAMCVGDSACTANCDALLPDGKAVFDAYQGCVLCGECLISCAETSGCLPP